MAQGQWAMTQVCNWSMHSDDNDDCGMENPVAKQSDNLNTVASLAGGLEIPRVTN